MSEQTDPHRDPWPLRNLTLRTPRVELRPDDDAGLAELVEVARKGIHDPNTMPFLSLWTDAPPEELAPNTMRYFWSARAGLVPEDWHVNCLVRTDGRVIGTQELHAQHFLVRREVSSGSWLGRTHQGRGLGTEMRAAVLLLAFDHLGAHTARSEAFGDNPASLGVSRKLGYVDDGTTVQLRRASSAGATVGGEARDLRAPPWALQVHGMEACRGQLGLGSPT
ncbi:MAG: GNAT family protein [Mycobacteriaceae bacterium]